MQDKVSLFGKPEEDNNPFPCDEGYQEHKKNSKILEARKPCKSRKFPIRILGKCDMHIWAKVGKSIGCGGFWGRGLGTTVEQGIESAISGVKQNARTYLLALSENREVYEGDKKIAEIILGYKGDIEDLFRLEYFDYNREAVESQLGRYCKLERKIVYNHK